MFDKDLFSTINYNDHPEIILTVETEDHKKEVRIKFRIEPWKNYDSRGFYWKRKKKNKNCEVDYEAWLGSIRKFDSCLDEIQDDYFY